MGGGTSSMADDSSLMSNRMGASKPVDAREMQSYAKVGGGCGGGGGGDCGRAGGYSFCCLPQVIDHWPRIPFETERRSCS